MISVSFWNEDYKDELKEMFIEKFHKYAGSDLFKRHIPSMLTAIGNAYDENEELFNDLLSQNYLLDTHPHPARHHKNRADFHLFFEDGFGNGYWSSIVFSFTFHPDSGDIALLSLSKEEMIDLGDYMGECEPVPVQDGICPEEIYPDPEGLPEELEEILVDDLEGEGEPIMYEEPAKDEEIKEVLEKVSSTIEELIAIYQKIRKDER